MIQYIGEFALKIMVRLGSFLNDLGIGIGVGGYS